MSVNGHGWAGSAHGSRGCPNKKGHPKGPQRIAPVSSGIGQLMALVDVLQWRSRLACADGLTGWGLAFRLGCQAARSGRPYKDALCWVVGCVKVLACGRRGEDKVVRSAWVQHISSPHLRLDPLQCPKVAMWCIGGIVTGISAVTDFE